jgi:GTPase-activator protein for Ras-like GTPase
MEENPNEISILDILELAHSLRQEKLSIETEMNDYFRLQMKLSENSFEAIKIAWISSLHRQNLNSLILSKPENRPSLCCQRATLLENVEFVEAHKDPSVKYQHLPQYIDLLRFIHQSPTVIAECLAIADDLMSIGASPASMKAEQMNQIAQIISAGLYGNSIHGKDVEMMLKLLEKLLELKVATCDVPRRLLRLSSSSFARLYHKFHESSLSSKLFLTAALHEPVMSVLIDDNNMLDESSEALFTLANQFITSISRNWIIFPSTIRWLVQTMSRLLQENHRDPATINEILIDMVFGHFICPACVSPDLYGISDAPISENARHNLIQIGQILQMLALARCPDGDKFATIFRRFDDNVISCLMEQLLENTYDISEMGLSHQLPTLYNIGRSSILMTHGEIALLVQFLKTTGGDNEKLKGMCDVLPVLIEAKNNGTIDTSPSKRATKIIKSTRKIVKNLSATSLNFEENGVDDSQDRVLIIPLTIYESSNKIRPLSEDEVLNMNQVTLSDSELTEKNVEMIEPESKKKRFVDDASIDNLELEAVSEAPSNHSVASSIDLEENNDNDNLSDMVSANVSGRGTPNISGRDTPSSQVIDGGEVPQIPTPQMAKILNKARNDIEDKFCKFEIKKLLEGDETISIISDTWSTDVLASDSETIEASERNFSTPLIPSNFTFR